MAPSSPTESCGLVVGDRQFLSTLRSRTAREAIVETPIPVRAGARVTHVVEVEGQVRPILLPAVVVWVRFLPNGRAVVGLEYVLSRRRAPKPVVLLNAPAEEITKPSGLTR